MSPNLMERDEKTNEIFRDEEFSFGVETGSSVGTEPSSEPVADTLADAADVRAPKPPKDEFLGGAVVFFIGASLLFGAGFFAYLGYRIVQTTQDDRASIETLGTEGTEEPVIAASEEAVVETPAVAEETVVEEKKELDKATVEIVVLNGGAPGGTAGKVTQILSDAGFAKAEAGNADKARSETEIFFGEGSEDAAEAVREALSDPYPDAKTTAADPKDPDTVVAPVTVVVAE